MSEPERTEPESEKAYVSMDCICGAEKREPLENLTPEFMANAFCGECGRPLKEIWEAALADLGIKSDSEPIEVAEDAVEPETQPQGQPAAQNGPSPEEVERRKQVSQAVFDTVRELLGMYPPMPLSSHFALIWLDEGVQPVRLAITYHEIGDTERNAMVRIERLTMLLATMTHQTLQATPDAFSRNVVRQKIAAILGPMMLPEGVKMPPNPRKNFGRN